MLLVLFNSFTSTIRLVRFSVVISGMNRVYPCMVCIGSSSSDSMGSVSASDRM